MSGLWSEHNYFFSQLRYFPATPTLHHQHGITMQATANVMDYLNRIRTYLCAANPPVLCIAIYSSSTYPMAGMQGGEAAPSRAKPKKTAQLHPRWISSNSDTRGVRGAACTRRRGMRPPGTTHRSCRALPAGTLSARRPSWRSPCSTQDEAHRLLLLLQWTNGQIKETIRQRDQEQSPHTPIQRPYVVIIKLTACRSTQQREHKESSYRAKPSHASFSIATSLRSVSVYMSSYVCCYSLRAHACLFITEEVLSIWNVEIKLPHHLMMLVASVLQEEHASMHYIVEAIVCTLNYRIPCLLASEGTAFLFLYLFLHVQNKQAIHV